MPLLAHGVDHTSLDGSPAGPADGDTHLVMTGQTVELPLQLSGISCQLLSVETEMMIKMMVLAQFITEYMTEVITLLSKVYTYVTSDQTANSSPPTAS